METQWLFKETFNLPIHFHFQVYAHLNKVLRVLIPELCRGILVQVCYSSAMWCLLVQFLVILLCSLAPQISVATISFPVLFVLVIYTLKHSFTVISVRCSGKVILNVCSVPNLHLKARSCFFYCLVKGREK